MADVYDTAEEAKAVRLLAPSQIWPLPSGKFALAINKGFKVPFAQDIPSGSTLAFNRKVHLDGPSK